MVQEVLMLFSWRGKKRLFWGTRHGKVVTIFSPSNHGIDPFILECNQMVWITSGKQGNRFNVFLMNVKICTFKKTSCYLFDFFQHSMKRKTRNWPNIHHSNSSQMLKLHYIWWLMYHKNLRGLPLLWVGGRGVPFLVHFSLSSNYIVSKCLSHEGKATVTQL